MNWFYEFNGAQKGPISESELDHLIAQGTVLPTTLVWREGLPNWIPLAQARVSAPPPMPGIGSDAVQCESCGRLFPASDVVQIAGRNICASCKPAVLQSLQQGTGYAEVGELARTGPAWEARETLGFFPAIRETVKAVLLTPSRAFSTMRVSGGLANPFWYNLICAGAGQIVLSIVIMMFKLPLGLNSPALHQAGSPLPAGFGPGVVLFQIVWSVVATAIMIFVQAAIVHVCLMICGGARRPYEATFRALCYGNGSVALLNLIPVVGSLAAIPWAIIVSCIGLARTHETETWRAVLAIFLPLIVCCVLAVVVAVIIGGIAGASHGLK